MEFLEKMEKKNKNYFFEYYDSKLNITENSCFYCGKSGTLYLINGKWLCEDCFEKETTCEICGS